MHISSAGGRKFKPLKKKSKNFRQKRYLRDSIIIRNKNNWSWCLRGNNYEDTFTPEFYIWRLQYVVSRSIHQQGFDICRYWKPRFISEWIRRIPVKLQPLDYFVAERCSQRNKWFKTSSSFMWDHKIERDIKDSTHLFKCQRRSEETLETNPST